MAKRKKAKQRRQPQQRMSAAEREMIESIRGMAEVLSCPVTTAADLTEYCSDLAHDHTARANLAEIARGLHARPGAVEQELGAILGDFIEVMREHAEQLSELAERFAALEDHDVDHGHVIPDDLPVHDIAVAMFGPPVDEEQAEP